MDTEKTREYLCNEYQFIERIGKGGFAEVYRAENRQSKQDVAVKILGTPDHSDIIERFAREARLFSQLKHKHLIPVYQGGVFDNHAYIVMRYIKGKSLDKVLKEKGKLPVETVLSIASQLCAALKYVHENGIVHRDIKPANVLVEELTGDVYLADFGIARSSAETTLTQTGMVMGTPHYISPEQAKGKPIDHRSDIYAFGAMLYQLISGKPVFEGDSALDILYRHVNQSPQPIEELEPATPKHIAYIIGKCLEKDADERFQAGGEILEILKNNKTPDETHLQETRVIAKRKRNLRVMIFLALVVTAALLVFLIGGNVFQSNTEPPGKNSGARVEVPGNAPGKDASNNNKSRTNKARTNKTKTNKAPNKEKKQLVPGKADGRGEGSDSSQSPAPGGNKRAENKDNGIVASKNNGAAANKGIERTSPGNTAHGPGSISFSSTPPGAEVFLKDKLLGDTSQILTRSFPSGRYTFTFIIDGSRSQLKTVTVKPGKHTSIHQKFPPSGSMTIIATPFAQIFVDGKEYGDTPLFNIKIPVGTYRLKAVKQGYLSKEIALIIKEKKNTHKFFTMTKDYRKSHGE
ncbi:MAG: protein kinase [bacterium]|nr:protein kinase [bacterium]